MATNVEGNKVWYGTKKDVHYVAVIEYSLSNLSSTQTRVHYTLRLRHTGSLYDKNNSAGTSGGLVDETTFGSFNYSRPSANSHVYKTGYRTYTRNPTDRTISQTFWVEGLADNSGGGARSTVTVTFTIPKNSSEGPPLKPITPTVTSITQSSAKINMRELSNNGSLITITGFYLAESATGDFTRNYGAEPVSLSHTFTGLEASKDYWAFVRAYNVHGWSEFSARKKFTTKALVAPDTPAAPTFSAIGEKFFTATVVAPATNGATITGYQYQVSRSTSMSPLIIDSHGSDRTRVLADDGLVPGGKHYVRVRVKSNHGYSGWSPRGEVFLDSPLGPPIPPPPIYHGQVGTAARLSLPDLPSGTLATEISVSPHSSHGGSFQVIGYREDDILALNTQVGREYYARLRAQDSSGNWSAWSINTIFTPASHAGIYINNGGTWAPGELFENVGGTWVRQEVWANKEGSWQPIA